MIMNFIPNQKQDCVCFLVSFTLLPRVATWQYYKIRPPVEDGIEIYKEDIELKKQGQKQFYYPTNCHKIDSYHNENMSAQLSGRIYQGVLIYHAPCIHTHYAHTRIYHYSYPFLHLLQFVVHNSLITRIIHHHGSLSPTQLVYVST